MAKQDDYIKTALRLPRELHADLRQSAQQMGRSLNSDIISRLLGSEKPNLREPVNLSTVAISTMVKDFESGDEHHPPGQGCAHDYVRSDRICIECGKRSSLHNGDTSDERNCAETQTGGFLELHAQINRLQEEVIAKGQRLSVMFDMHREFMQLYEDLVRDRDNWQVLAEKNNGR